MSMVSVRRSVSLHDSRLTARTIFDSLISGLEYVIISIYPVIMLRVPSQHPMKMLKEVVTQQVENMLDYLPDSCGAGTIRSALDPRVPLSGSFHSTFALYPYRLPRGKFETDPALAKNVCH